MFIIEFINQNISVLALSFLSGSATFLGVFLGSRGKKTNETVAFGTAFAAGIMVLISFFELIPGAFKGIGYTSFLWVSIGILVVWGINETLPHLHSVKEIEDCDAKCMVKMSYILAIGFILHDFPEGFAIPSSFEASRNLGLLLAVATFIHNIPEGYVLTVASAKYEKNKFFYKSAMFSAISTLSGAILGIILIHWLGFLNSYFLSVAAGAMLFIACHELIPISLRNGQKKASLAGAIATVLLYITMDIVL